jgi:arginine-tRNA-protein transferase
MSNPATQKSIDDLLDSDAVPLGPEFDCPYLPPRKAQFRCFLAGELEPEIYHALMDRRFRRSGNLLYQPNCPACSECRQLRVPVAEFKPTKSQRRIWHRNRDIRAKLIKPQLTDEKWRLYSRYLEYQHDGTMSDEYNDLRSFLFSSPVRSVEFDYYLGERLVGVSIADESQAVLSSVYMFFDPDHADRSLGTFSALWELDHCRRSNIHYYYLGFYIRNCTKMSYKA